METTSCMDVKVKNGSPWPEAVQISFSQFVQEADEEGVQRGRRHYKQACLRSGCAGNKPRVFCFCAHLAGIDELICLVLS